MTKRQLIDEIISLNHSAEPDFLASFKDSELDAYLRHMQWGRTPRLAGDIHRFDHYFEGCPTIAVQANAHMDDDAAVMVAEYIEDDSLQGDTIVQQDPGVSENAFFNQGIEVTDSDEQGSQGVLGEPGQESAA